MKIQSIINRSYKRSLKMGFWENERTVSELLFPIIAGCIEIERVGGDRFDKAVAETAVRIANILGHSGYKDNNIGLPKEFVDGLGKDIGADLMHVIVRVCTETGTINPTQLSVALRILLEIGRAHGDYKELGMNAHIKEILSEKF